MSTDQHDRTAEPSDPFDAHGLERVWDDLEAIARRIDAARAHEGDPATDDGDEPAPDDGDRASTDGDAREDGDDR